MNKCIPEVARLLDDCVNPVPIIRKVCGRRANPMTKPKLNVGNSKFCSDGRKSFRKFFDHVCRLPHVSIMNIP